MPDIEKLFCKCKNCNTEFELNNSCLETREIETNGDRIYIKIIQCPFCGDEKTVQIDNEQTLKMLHKQFSISAEIGAKKALRKTTKKLERRYSEISNIIIHFRKELNYIYNNSVYYFGNKNYKIELDEPSIKILGDSEG